MSQPPMVMYLAAGGAMHQIRYDLFVSPDGVGWMASTPDLPGCSAHGPTPEDAVAELRHAVQQHIEARVGRGLPGLPTTPTT